MKKFIIIFIILIILFLLYKFSSKETFNNNNSKIKNLGYKNLNYFTPLKCNLNSETENTFEEIEVDNNDYTNCFSNEKYVEIDTNSKKCRLYDNISCEGENAGNILDDLTTQDKLIFRIKSREILNQDETKLNAYISKLYTDSANFKNSDNFMEDFFTDLSLTKHINYDDYFCFLVEHLFVVRIIPSLQSNTSENIINKLDSLNVEGRLINIFNLLNLQNFDIDNYENYFIKNQGDIDNGIQPTFLLCYNIHVLKVLLLFYIMKNIKTDDYFKKYNSSYITYLFHSFKRGKKIWGNYFEKCIDKFPEIDNYYKKILKKVIIDKFFMTQNNENIYKLFIYISALQNNNSLKYINDSQSSLNIISYNNENKLNPLYNIENNLFIFYYEGEVVDNNKFCSIAKDKENCSKIETLGCKFDDTKNKCIGDYTFKNCMQYLGEENCPKERCDFLNDKCVPKSCFSNEGHAVCNNLPHCENIPDFEINNQIWNLCHDNVRTVINSENEINENFYEKKHNINDKCLNKIYNGDNLDNVNNLYKKCNDGCILSSHNDSQVCVNPNFINKDNFFDNKYCKKIKNELNCDFSPHCFWQSNNCHPNSTGNDSMKCNDFSSEERCPINRCIWYDNKCNDIYNSNPEVNLQVSQNANNEVDTNNFNFNIKKVDCLAINNQQSNNEKLNECLYNNCEWQNERNLCVDKINKGCLFKNESDCVNPQINYDNILNKNKCKLITNQSYNNYGKKICVNNEFKIPCDYYTKEDCPTLENPKVNLQGDITEEPYCKISANGNKCIEKKNIENETCMYNYLSSEIKGDNYSKNCREIELLNPDTNQKFNYSVNKENLPCSQLNLNNCLFDNNSKTCNIYQGQCKTNKDKGILYEKLNELSSNMSLKNYKEITDTVGNIYAKKRHNKLCRINDQINGSLLSINDNIVQTTNNLNEISIINNYIIFFVHMNFNDLVEIFEIDTSGPTFQAKKIEYQNLLDNLNVVIKSKIELNHKFNLDNIRQIWISKKYEIANINKDERKILLPEKLYNKFDSTLIQTKLGRISIQNINNIERSEEIGLNKVFKIPYFKLIKWFIPNPMANLDDCLNDIILKNLDSEGNFNL